MKTIKFRAWDKKEKRWCGRDLAGFVLIDENNKPQQGIQWATKSDNQVLMQFTGLKDKNGKEIYEGDIVRCSPYKPKLVYYDEYVGGFYPFYLKTDEERSRLAKDPEIVGNIFENPELLK